jgi:hypothetical protein
MKFEARLDKCLYGAELSWADASYGTQRPITVFTRALLFASCVLPSFLAEHSNYSLFGLLQLTPSVSLQVSPSFSTTDWLFGLYFLWLFYDYVGGSGIISTSKIFSEIITIHTVHIAVLLCACAGVLKLVYAFCVPLYKDIVTCTCC